VPAACSRRFGILAGQPIGYRSNVRSGVLRSLLHLPAATDATSI
jgi:hypothetical protein